MTNSLKKILIVDDDESIVEIVKMTLEMDGYEVTFTCNGLEAIPSLDKVCLPDLIFLDIFMPGADGRQICKAIKANPATHDIQILLVSASLNVQQSADESGADGYLTKPFELSALKQKINSMVGRQ